MKEHLVEIQGWKEGFQKVKSTKFIQSTFGLNLKEAKSYTDRIIDGELVCFSCATSVDAQEFSEKMKSLGAVVKENAEI